MAEITTKELAEGLAKAREEAVKLNAQFEASLGTITKLANLMASQKGGLNLGDAKDLERFNTLYEERTALVERRIKADANLLKSKALMQKVDKEEVKILQESEKLKQAEIKTIKEAEKNKQELLKTQKLQNQATKEDSKIKKKAIDLTDDEIKQQIILRKSNAQRKKDLEAELILEAKSIKNKQDLTDRLRALSIEGAKLDLGSDEAKANIEELNKLRQLLSDNSDEFTKNKINIGNYKSATEGLTLSFEDQKKKLAILEETYKDFRLSGAKATKDSKALKEALEDQKKTLEGLKDAGEDTGKALTTMGAVFKALGIGLIVAAIAKIGEFFGSSREASLESAKSFAVFTETIKVFFANTVNAFGGIKVVFNSFVNSFKIGFNSIQLFGAKAAKGFEELRDKIGLPNAAENLAKATEEIKRLTAEQKELSKETATVSEGWDMITASFSKTTTVIPEAIKSQQAFLQLQQDTTISIERQTRALAGLQEERQILQDISDDDTLGFETRALAVERAEKAADKFAKKEISLAKTKEKLTIEAIKQDLLTSGIRSAAFLKEIQSGEALNALLKKTGIARKVSDENESAFTEAFTERVEKETEIRAFQRDQEEKFRITERDSYEQRQDIIEEFAELQLAKNEEIIADETQSQEKRLAAFEKNQRESQNLINETTALTLDQARNSIDINKRLSDSEKEIAKEKLNNFDVNALVLEQDEQIIFNKIRALDLGEIEEKRLKESIKIRKEQIEANKLTAIEIEQSQRDAAELQKELDAQQKVLDAAKVKDAEVFNEALEELDRERFNNKVELLRKEIELLDDGSKAELEKKKELNNLLIQEEERLTAKDKEESDKRKKEAEENSKFLKDTFFATTKAFFEGRKKLSEQREDDINEEIQESKVRNSELLALSKSTDSQTSQLAADSLAEQRALERKKTEELEKEKRKQVRLDLVLSGLSILKNNADKPNAGVKTLADVGALLAGLTTLGGSFKKGTDRLGSNGKGIDSDGGMLNVNHPDEMIIQAPLVKQMGFPSRHDVADVFTRYNNGDLLDKGLAQSATLQTIVVNSDNKAVVNELKAVKNELKNTNNAKLVIDTARGMLAIKERKGNRINKYI